MDISRRLTVSFAKLRGHQSSANTTSKSPTLKAYICESLEHYSVAERTFYTQWQRKRKDHGPWDKRTVLSLNNWIITLIKLKRFEEAETQCKSSLDTMIVGGLQGSPQYLCMLCSLTACQFLTGNLAAAEAQFSAIKEHEGFLQYDPAKGFFEVLSKTMTMRTDYLVLRDSEDGVPNLIDLTNIVTPSCDDAKTNWGQGRMRAIGRVALTLILSTLLRPPSSVQRPGSYRMSQPSQPINTTPHLQPLPALAIQTLTRVDETMNVAGWLNEQKRNPPLPNIPETMSPIPPPPPTPFDTLLGYTNRSTETTQTTRTSQMYDIKLQNKLAIKAWVTGKKHQLLELNAWLDSGATENCVSEAFCTEIGAEFDTGEIKPLSGADGLPLVVLGRTKVTFSFDRPFGGTFIAKIECCVIKDLQVAMLICERYIVHYKLRDLPGIVAPILLASRTKITKKADAQISQAIGDAAMIREAGDAAQRKADRKRLDEIDKVNMSSPLSDTDSLFGGSETAIESRTSSMTGPIKDQH